MEERVIPRESLPSMRGSEQNYYTNYSPLPNESQKFYSIKHAHEGRNLKNNGNDEQKGKGSERNSEQSSDDKEELDNDGISSNSMHNVQKDRLFIAKNNLKLNIFLNLFLMACMGVVYFLDWYCYEQDVICSRYLLGQLNTLQAAVHFHQLKMGFHQGVCQSRLSHSYLNKRQILSLLIFYDNF